LHTRHDDIVLVVGEATSNATLHAYAEDPPGPVQLSCLLVDDHAEFRVRDWGSWRTMPAQHDGRGLQLMASLADAFEVRRHDDGTEVVLTFGM
jgi:anti-sigma regulatory factor (Ser/Thr protein kinase)